MRDIDKHRLCTKYINRIGRRCTICRADGSEETVLAVVEMVWRRSKSKFEPKNYPIGNVQDDYYIYTGPADVDITMLTDADTVVIDGKKHCFIRSDCVRIGDRVQFYTGVLKRVFEEEYDEL